MTDRLTILINEIRQKCAIEKQAEFEYHWEYWGYLWYPWFLSINGKPQSFSFNDISYDDLKGLCQEGLIELIKEYSDKEVDEDEDDKKRYRIIS